MSYTNGANGKPGANLPAHTVIIDVSPDGTTEIAVNGVKGQACSDVTKSLIDALGGDVAETRPTTEAQEGTSAHHATVRNNAVNRA